MELLRALRLFVHEECEGVSVDAQAVLALHSTTQLL